MQRPVQSTPRTPVYLLCSLALCSVALTAAACSDDGETVRGEVTELDAGTLDGTSSASGSASASGSGSGSASASAPAADAAETPGDGGYEYASNVDAHRMVVADICPVGDLLDAGDFDAVATIYRDGGNSVNSDGSVRTIAGFATNDEALHGLDAYYDAPTPLDDFISAALDGTGIFSGTSDAVRGQGVEKGMQNQVMVAWVRHELATALAKAEDGDFDIESGAVHNWDEGWAFYHGAEPGCSPWATGNSRAGNFGTTGADGSTALANEAILAAMIEGRDALVAGNAASAPSATDEVVRGIMIIYSQATIRYASLIEGDLAEDDEALAAIHQAEGLAFFRVIEADVAAAGGDVATINAILSLDNEPGANGFGDEVTAALAPAWDAFGITADDIGVLQ